MEWIRLHPYASALAVACLLVILGAILVVDRSAVPSSPPLGAWSGNPGVITVATVPTATTPAASAAQSQAITASIVAEDYGTQTLPYTQNTPVPDSEGTIQTASASSSFDFNTLLAEISQSAKPNPSSSAAAPTTGDDSVNAWSYIPTGLIGTTSPSAGRTATQQSLYQYGNEIGSYVEGYDAAQRQQSQILSDAMNDRQNAAKEKAVEGVGQSLETVGEGIAETTDVPSMAVSDNTALSNSYIDIGKKLITVAQSESMQDSALVSAMEAYDSAVDTFNKNYVALSTLFSSYGVTFNNSDPGTVFSFTSNTL